MCWQTDRVEAGGSAGHFDLEAGLARQCFQVIALLVSDHEVDTLISYRLAAITASNRKEAEHRNRLGDTQLLRAYVSVWSADLLAIAASLDPIADAADGLHVDITDGHLVPELLFGPDLVAALRKRYPSLPIEAHLMVTDADGWVGRMADAGASMVSVHPRSTRDLGRSLAHIAEVGARPGLALELSDSLDIAAASSEAIDRILLMGTLIGIKGVDIAPEIYDRVRRAIQIREASTRRPDVFVDGGIRTHTTPLINEAGADGVIPGSLVLSAPDPRAAIRGLHAMP